MRSDNQDRAQAIEEAVATWRARGEELKKCGQQLRRAMRRWDGVKTQAHWEQVVSQSRDDLDTGQFLLDRLGAEVNLEPEVIATLLILRGDFIRVHGVTTPAEYMLMDMALIAYYNTLRAQRMLGDLAILIEAEFFSQDAPRVKLRGRYGPDADGYPVEDMLERAKGQLHGLVERANRMLIKNLSALRELKEGSLVIHADQVNIARQQVNQQVAVADKKRAL